MGNGAREIPRGYPKKKKHMPTLLKPVEKINLEQLKRHLINVEGEDTIWHPDGFCCSNSNMEVGVLGRAQLTEF